MSLRGHADNLKDGTVEIICEGEKDKIVELVDRIKETPSQFARVDLVNPQWHDYIGDLKEPECSWRA